MFGTLFKRPAPNSNNMDRAERLYAAALGQTRHCMFFEKLGVPDTFDGRFDLLLLHIFLIMDALMKQGGKEDLSQALFDVTFRDMDQTLREMGIGDMGVPKHMRRMMKAYNGRMHAYKMALEPESLAGVKIEGLKPASLQEVLKRNLYATVPDVTAEQVQDMAAYIVKNATGLKIEDDKAIIFEEPDCRG
jgi:cytochrome b pre-mRNA-processing protein 3